MKRLLLCLLLPLAWPVKAGELRAFEPIALPGEFSAVTSRLPVPAEEVERFVHRVAAAWNGSELRTLLAEEFPNRQRLIDALRLNLPLDARLRILSVGTMQTLSQRTVPGGRVSEVLVRVHGQVEFIAEDGQPRRLPTSQEWVLQIAQQLP